MSTFSKHIAQIREDYSLATFDEIAAGDNPIYLFEKWFTEAEQSEIIDVNAMSLATVDKEQQPHIRTVLLKGLEDGSFIFFTNYSSNKGAEINQNNKVSVLFFWKELQRQVRIEGSIKLIEAQASDAYFASRPYGSKIGAIASPQSKVIPNRSFLEDAVATVKKQYSEEDVVPRPENWGGYAIKPSKIEFWQGRSSRLHDRIVFELDEQGNWKKYRIAP